MRVHLFGSSVDRKQGERERKRRMLDTDYVLALNHKIKRQEIRWAIGH
jgi:hypothetical protein